MSDIFTGFDIVAGGMNNLFSPELISAQNYAKAINVFTRGGKARTRPGFTRMILAGGDATEFKDSAWQGGAVHRNMGNDYLIVAANGRIYGINMNNMNVNKYPVMMDAFADKMWFCQANESMIVQDGVSRPAIIQGSQVSQSLTDTDAANKKLPVGRNMAFGHGRLFVQVTDRLFLAGDIQLPWKPESMFGFKETEYYAGGGALGIPANLGNITAMVMQQNVSSGTGLGPLLVFCENGVSAFAIKALRSTWTTIDLSQVVFTNAGAVGQDSVVPINSDILFRGWDGIRTLKQTASEISGSAVLRNMPFSEAIDGIFKEDTRWMLPYASMVVYDNRLYCTTGGEMSYIADPSRGRIANQVVFNGIVTCDMRNPQGVAWESVLTGLKVYKVFTAQRYGRERLFAVAYDTDNDDIAIYMLDDAAYGVDGDKKISTTSRIYTRSFDFSTPDVARGGIEKRFISADFDLKDVRGNVKVRLYARAGGQPVWVDCGVFEMAASMNAAAGQTLWPQAYRRMRLTAPETGGADATDNELLVGKTLEFCIEWTGHMTIDKVIIKAQMLPEDHDVPNPNPESKLLEGLSIYDYDYSVDQGLIVT